MPRCAEPLIVQIGFFVIEDLDDLLAFGADHHRVVFRVEMDRPPTALKQLGNFLTSFLRDPARLAVEVDIF